MSACPPFRSAHGSAALVAAFLLGILTVPAAAQERSDTGRKRPPAPAPKTTTTPQALPGFAAGGERWIAGVGFGAIDAGDLFRVETVNGVALPWGEVGRPRFTASRFTATIDPGSAVSAFAGRRLGGGRWWLRGELSRGASDVAAEALLGQNGEVFLFDRLTFLTAGMGAEARLTAYPSHPYGSVGLTICRITADRARDLDQTGLGFHAAFGYRQRLGGALVALETQLRRIAIDVKDFRPSASGGSQPVVAYEPSDDLWLFEIRLIASRTW
jgi:hypothetical protein